MTLWFGGIPRDIAVLLGAGVLAGRVNPSFYMTKVG